MPLGVLKLILAFQYIECVLALPLHPLSTCVQLRLLLPVLVIDRHQTHGMVIVNIEVLGCLVVLD